MFNISLLLNNDIFLYGKKEISKYQQNMRTGRFFSWWKKKKINVNKYLNMSIESTCIVLIFTKYNRFITRLKLMNGLLPLYLPREKLWNLKSPFFIWLRAKVLSFCNASKFFKYWIGKGSRYRYIFFVVESFQCWHSFIEYDCALCVWLSCFSLFVNVPFLCFLFPYLRWGGCMIKNRSCFLKRLKKKKNKQTRSVITSTYTFLPLSGGKNSLLQGKSPLLG